MAEPKPSPSAAEFVQLADRLIATTEPGEITALAEACRPLLESALELFVRDPGFLGLMLPGQIVCESGVDPSTFDLSRAEAHGFDEVLTAIVADLEVEGVVVAVPLMPPRSHNPEKCRPIGIYPAPAPLRADYYRERSK
ncbi:MAG: hypothetical protein ACREOD_06770 [Candidatus Dormibacteria bacterium]